MWTPRRLIGIALLSILVFAGTSSVRAADFPVTLLKGNAKFGTSRSGDARHKLKLILLAPKLQIAQHDAFAHPLRISLDDVVLCDAPVNSEGFKTYRSGRWRYRGEIANGRVQVNAHPATGRIKVKITRADLPELKSSAAVNMDLALQLADFSLGATASFRIVDGNKRRWISLRPSSAKGPGSNPAPDPDPRPVPDPVPAPVDWIDALLADLNERDVDFFQDGTSSPSGGLDPRTLRCDDGELAEVVQLVVPPPGSTDFFTETAYICHAGNQYWAHLTGGFAGVSLWVGPFDLP